MAEERFKHLNLEMPDEEELVIRAGSPRAAGEEAPGIPGTAEVSDAAESEHEDPAERASADTEDPRMRELKRRAEELAAAEEGLQAPAKMPRMQLYVLGALALLVVALVVYTVFMPR